MKTNEERMETKMDTNKEWLDFKHTPLKERQMPR
jgi:hypothetical protein